MSKIWPTQEESKIIPRRNDMNTNTEVEINIELREAEYSFGEEWELLVEETDCIGPEITKKCFGSYPPS